MKGEGPRLDHVNRLLADKDYVYNLKKKRGGFAAITKKLLAFAVLVGFVTNFVLVVLYEDRATNRIFEGLVKETFEKNDKVALDDVNSVPMFWSYLNHTLLPEFLFGGSKKTMGLSFQRLFDKTQLESRLIDRYGTRLVGEKVLLRTFRVDEKYSCEVPSNALSDAMRCYGAYSAETKTEYLYGLSKNHAFQSGDKQEVAKKTNVTVPIFPPVQGQLATYEGNGYIQTIGESFVVASGALNDLVQYRYVDEATRAVMIEFNLWNANEGLIGIVKILFEISETGSWYNSFQFDVISERYLNLSFDSGLLMELLLIIPLFYYFSQDVTELVISKSDYFKDAWNIVDWATVILLCAFLVTRFQCYMISINHEMLQNLATSDKYTDLSYAAHYIRQSRNINALNTVLVAFKVVKMVPILPYVKTMIYTLKYGWQYFLSFLIIFGSIIVGVALCISVGFGDKFTYLRDMGRSVSFLMQGFLARGEMSELYVYSKFLTAIITIVIVLTVYMLIMNLFYGLMISAVSDANIRMNDIKKDEITKTLERMMSILTVKFKEMLFWFEETLRRFFPTAFYYIDIRRRTEHSVQAERLAKKQEKKEIMEASFYFTDGGPASLHRGTRTKNFRSPSRRNTGGDNEKMKLRGIDSSSDSEVDLGPMSNSDILFRKSLSLKGTKSADSETELYFMAVDHVVDVLRKRGNIAQDYIQGEIDNIALTFKTISKMVDIITQRTKDLNHQQGVFLGREDW